MVEPAWLMLEDGTLFEGKLIGKKGVSGGEICFNTGMTGYQEIFTDPSYYGQVIVTTVCHVGNYGTHLNEVESDKVQFNGLICNTISITPSRRDSDSSLDEYLSKNGITGISGIDTRALVRHIRNKGVMNVVISGISGDTNHLKKELSKLPNMENLELSSKVTTDNIYDVESDGDLKLAILDLGIKWGIINSLKSRGFNMRVFPAQTSYEEMLKWNPDAFFISNGPGDPSSMGYAINTTKKIIENSHPLFGICLGHQIIALSLGLTTYKMHNGHRGVNHPVKNLLTGRSEVTSQNHGFAVSADGVDKLGDVEITHINLNDNTVEGIRMTTKPVFSVQYHPESNPGPHDSRYLFDNFRNLVERSLDIKKNLLPL